MHRTIFGIYLFLLANSQILTGCGFKTAAKPFLAPSPTLFEAETLRRHNKSDTAPQDLAKP